MSCSGDGLGDPLGLWLFVEEGEYMVILHFPLPVRKRNRFIFTPWIVPEFVPSLWDGSAGSRAWGQDGRGCVLRRARKSLAGW